MLQAEWSRLTRWSGNECGVLKRKKDNVALGANGREWKRPEGHREAEEHTALGIKVGIILKNHAELPESLNRVWSDLGLKKNTQIM